MIFHEIKSDGLKEKWDCVGLFREMALAECLDMSLDADLSLKRAIDDGPLVHTTGSINPGTDWHVMPSHRVRLMAF